MLGWPHAPGNFGVSGAQTGLPDAHSRPLRGNPGMGMGVVIPCALDGAWTGDSVGTILLKPSAAPLEILRSSIVSTARVTAHYG
ncbi:hypothetical protein [Nitrosomonas communis]|uniref:Uncharacterized protein n=1 Tax=Nitrosomonas communis TaxID=44574 RepID=A0A1I4RJ50_9PROT|nr:hypothetical protein [Nitrosomonas communis]SFM52235.1 hypothetical protein SAMN05421863_103323 [Nitrosomonas communis]